MLPYRTSHVSNIEKSTFVIAVVNELGISIGESQGKLIIYLLVVACVQCVSSLFIGAELQCEERIFAPRNVGVDMDFVLRFRQMREPFASNGAQVYLASGETKVVRRN